MIFYYQLLLTIKKSEKQKTFQILEITKENFNIKSNRLVRVKTKSGIMSSNLIILLKLLKIFIFIIIINPDLRINEI